MKPGTPLYHLAIDRYPALKAQWPTAGRRKVLLRLAEEFWTNTEDSKSLADSSQSIATENLPSMAVLQDADPHDQLTDGPELGILLRTDYSDEDAWKAFYARLQEGERELAEATEEEEQAVPEDVAGSVNASQSARVDEDVEMAGEDDEEEDEDEDEDEGPPRMFKVINPDLTQDRAIFAHISNLTALRLLNDLDIRQAPSPPLGTKRVSPPNQLVDQKGWQEIYTGKPLWIYDSRSNTDQCVRVVSQEGASLYGTATADSWRARVTHICEIQMNMCAGMKIDFGERDGWDYSERRRNLGEASAGFVS